MDHRDPYYERRVIKIAVVGPGAAGKSSLSYRFGNKELPGTMMATIGASFDVRVLELDGKEYSVQIWDVAGQIRFIPLSGDLFKAVGGFIFVYDITDEGNFAEAEDWMKQIREIQNVRDSEMIILGNKCDLEKHREVSRIKGYQFAAKYGAKFFEVSAKSCVNVEVSLVTLVKDIVAKKFGTKENQVPEEILHDPFALDLYKKALTAGREKDKSIRINVVGNYKQGKTSLTRRLLGHDIKNVESTNGIVVEHYKCQKTNDGQLGYSKADENNKPDYIRRLAKVAVNCELKDEEDHKMPFSSDRMSDIDTKQETIPVTVEEPLSSSNTYSSKTGLDNGSETEYASSSEQESMEVVYSKISILSTDEKGMFAKVLKTVESSSENEIQTVLDIWDFGGQYVFYATHTIFHSRKAIYLLVVDLSLDLNQCLTDDDFPTDTGGRNMKYFLQFWMSSIHSFVGSADGSLPKVILVGTHKDKLKGSKAEREAYIKKYFSDVRQMFDDTTLLNHIYIEDFAVDNTNVNDTSLVLLRETISKIGDEQSETLEIPLKWIQLEKSLLERKHLKLISMEFVLSIDAENEFPLGDVEQVKLFLRYHHAKGTFVYFDEEPVSDVVVLDPQYLIDAFKSIITSQRFCTNDPEIRPLWNMLLSGGRLEEGLIEKQWGKPEDADQMYIENKKILLSFLVKHHIISEAEAFDETTQQSTGLGWYVVPSMLTDHSSKTEIQDFLHGKKQTNLRYVFLFDSSPIVPTIYHRLISAAVGKWPVAKAGKQTFMFKNLCILRLNIDHTAIAELKVETIELTVVSLCPTAEIDAEQSDQFRRFFEAVLTFEFQKLRNPEETVARPYTVWFRCNHESHEIAGSENIISVDDLQCRKLVPCPDLKSHEINVDEAKGEWFHDSRNISVIPDIQLTDKLLASVSQCIGENWQLLGYELGLTKIMLEHIVEDHPNSVVMRIYVMLQTWCQKDVDVTTMAALVQIMQGCPHVSFDWDKLRNILDDLK